MAETFIFLNITKSNLLRSTADRLLFRKIKEYVLGPNYELSFVFVIEKEMQKINKKCKGKDKPTNILSFPLSSASGEIFICPSYARREAAKFDRSYKNYVSYLFIHGLVHLKGFDHGSTMEREEQEVRSRFGI